MKFFTRQWWTLVLAAVLAVGGGCVSYGQTRPAALVGQWVDLGGQKVMELFADGTGVAKGVSITWNVQNNRFIVQAGGKGSVGDYKISGYELVLTDDKGESDKLIRKENWEEFKGKEQQRIEKMSRYFIDSRDGQKYRKVRIGGKVWMAENLNYKTGDSEYCGGSGECNEYGRLYRWETAKTACPDGWHLPSRQEWNDLKTASGGEKMAYKALMSTSGWNNGSGTDEFGFSAKPAGALTFRNGRGSFVQVGKAGSWWTATAGNNNGAYFFAIGNDFIDEMECVGGMDCMGNHLSVRCVAD